MLFWNKNRESMVTVYVVSSLIISFSLLSKVYYTGNEKVVVIGKFESKNSLISYITFNGQKYIIKQKKDSTKQVMAAIREALASYIARKLNIAHSVQIIVATSMIPGKIYRWYPATLHTLAPGKMVSELVGHKYYHLCLKQRDHRKNKVTGKWLTETIIQQITWHKHLAIIIALDLFLGNTDRNRRNLFYDAITDSFCAIDMENIYRRNVALFACKKLDEMVSVHKKQFTQEEIEALVLVKNTLEFLLKEYPPDKIVAHFDKYAILAGYVTDGSSFSNRITKKIARHKTMINQSYVSTQKFVKMLDTIITDFYA